MSGYVYALSTTQRPFVLTNSYTWNVVWDTERCIEVSQQAGADGYTLVVGNGPLVGETLAVWNHRFPQKNLTLRGLHDEWEAFNYLRLTTPFQAKYHLTGANNGTQHRRKSVQWTPRI